MNDEQVVAELSDKLHRQIGELFNGSLKNGTSLKVIISAAIREAITLTRKQDAESAGCKSGNQHIRCELKEGHQGSQHVMSGQGMRITWSDGGILDGPPLYLSQNTEALRSAIDFLEGRLVKRKCDDEGVGSCERCNTIFLARKVADLLKLADTKIGD